MNAMDVKKWLFRILWIPTLLGVVLFLWANRSPVAISFDPFNVNNPSIATYALPLWFWLMTVLFLGLGLGSVGMWLSGASRRSQARAHRREIKALKKELAVMAARAANTTEDSSAPEPPKLEATTI